MTSPPAGVLAAHVDVPPARLEEVRAAVAAAGVVVRASHVQGLDEGGALGQDLWLEYARLEDVLALLNALQAHARVAPSRVWCAACARWHEAADGGRRMVVPAEAPCRGAPR